MKVNNRSWYYLSRLCNGTHAESFWQTLNSTLEVMLTWKSIIKYILFFFSESYRYSVRVVACCLRVIKLRYWWRQVFFFFFFLVFIFIFPSFYYMFDWLKPFYTFSTVDMCKWYLSYKASFFHQGTVSKFRHWHLAHFKWKLNTLLFAYFIIRALIKLKKTTYCPILSRVSMQMWFILRTSRFCISW